MYLSFSAEKTHNASTDRVNCTCLSWATVSMTQFQNLFMSSETNQMVIILIKPNTTPPNGANGSVLVIV
jgi:hypothetical protein